MDKKYAKFFKLKKEEKNEVVLFNYKPGQDEYYAFVKKYCDEGYKQIIITSEIMIKALKYYYRDRSFEITDIEFMIDDENLSDEISYILKKMSGDRAYFNDLIEQLKFLAEESIDIKKISLRGMSGDNQTLLYLEVNGIFHGLSNSFEIESDKLRGKISEYINK